MKKIMEPPKDSDLRNPSSLFQQCVDRIRSNLSEVFLQEKIPRSRDWKWKNQSYQLKREDVYIPGPILEHLLTGYNRPNDELIFLRLTLTRTEMSQSIKMLSLRNCEDLDDNTLARIMNPRITSLDIHGCPRLTLKSFNVINTYGANLTELVIGNSVKVLPVTIFRGYEQGGCDNDPAIGWRSLVQKLSTRMSRLVTKSSRPGEDEDHTAALLEAEMKKARKEETLYHLWTPKLTKLVIWGHNVQQMMSDPKIGRCYETPRQVNYWTTLFKPFVGRLKYLDLSNCTGVKNLDFLLEAMHSLEVLVLHDIHVPETPEGWGIIQRLYRLRFLDVSESVELAALYKTPETLLSDTLESLQNLKGLDISGTNLAGSGINNDQALRSRKFAFLGLVCTHFHADRRDFNAAKIAGTYGEDQIITGIKQYINRPGMLKKSIRSLLQAISTYEGFQYTIHTHSLMAEILETHRNDKATVTLVFAYLRKPFTTGGLSDFDIQDKVSFKVRLRIAENIIGIIGNRINEPELFLAGIYILKHYSIFNFSKRLHFARLLLQRMEMGFPDPQETWWVQWMLYDCSILLKELINAMDSHAEEFVQLLSFGCVKILIRVLENLGSNGLVQDSLSFIWAILNTLMNNVEIGQAVRSEFLTYKGLKAFVKCVENNRPRETRFCPKLPALCCISTVSELKELRKHFCEESKIINYLINLIFGRDTEGNNLHGQALKSHMRLFAMTCMCNLFTERPDARSMYGGNPEEFIKVIEEVVESSETNPKLVEALKYNDIHHLIELIESKAEASQMFGMWVIYAVVLMYPETYIPLVAPFVKRCTEVAESEINANHPYNLRFLKPALSVINNFANGKSELCISN